MSGNWTDKQLDAINAKGCAVLVSAAAGSGKTSVLVERLLRLLSDTENKIPADKMVVVTFTNDAAAQMKQKLVSALSELIEKHPTDDWLCRQQALVQTAKISTIHSFCFDLIRENIQMLNISSGFRILDEAENDSVTASAINNVFEKLYSENPDLMNKLCDFFSGSRRDDILLEKNILAIYDFLMSIPFYEDWLDLQLANIDAGFDPGNNILANMYISEISGNYSECLKYSESALNLCSKICSCSNFHIDKSYNEKAYNALCNDVEFFRKRVKEINDISKHWDERIGICDYSFDTLRFSKLDVNSESYVYESETREHIKDLRNKCKELYKKTVKSLFKLEDIKDDYNVTRDILEGIITIIKLLAAETGSIKEKKNALSFSDAEQLTVRLLARKNENGEIVRTPLAKDLSEYYKLIMIDEFQDSNNTQDMIFKLISHGGSPYHTGDNIFVVGDVKQSIYRFRLANPRLFIAALDNAENYPCKEDGQSARIILNKNFRSSRNTVDFVNYVFNHLMSRNVGDVEYNSEEALVCGTDFPDTDGNGVRIDRTPEILYIDPCSASNIPDNEEIECEDEDENENVEVTKSDIAEAKAVAKKIHSMAGKTFVYENGALRKSEYRDFCILLRGNKAQKLFSDELAQYGIKASVNAPEGYLKSREINVLTSLLSIIDNPLQDIPLVTVLMSPMFMLDANDTARLRILAEDAKSPLYNAVRVVVEHNSESQEVDFSDPLYMKLSAFMRIYDSLRYHAASQSLERLIRTIYDSTDFLSAVQVYKDGEQKKANLRLLLHYAKSYEDNSAGGLSGFLRYLSSMSERGSDFAAAPTVSASENAVSVKTIHRSKGLEYPYVFLCGTSKRFNLLSSGNSGQELSVCFNLDYGIGFKIQKRELLQSYESFTRFMIKKINRSELLSEEMRLLYVALTRAKEQLFISIVDDNKTAASVNALSSEISMSGGLTPSIISSAKSMQEWILSVLVMHPDFCKTIGVNSVKCKNNHPPLMVTKTDCGFSGSVDFMESNIPLPEPAQVKTLLERFAFKYDDNLTNTAAKLTITEIAKKEAEQELYFSRPYFMTGEKGLSPAEVGTAMHSFMQYADFTKAEKDTVKEAARLTDSGILTEIQRDSLIYPKLDAFFRSDLYKRIKSSNEIYRERKFLVGISELSLDDELGLEYNNTNGMLQGIADCIFKEQDGFVLIDYKTDRSNNPELLISKYRRQLMLYSMAIEKLYGFPVKETFIYSFSLDSHIEVSNTTVRKC